MRIRRDKKSDKDYGNVLINTEYPEYTHYSSKIITETVPIAFSPQHQDKSPGLEYLMNPKPIFDNLNYKASDKLKNKTAIITGGDSGLGRAVAVGYAKEGCNVIIGYLDYEQKDAEFTKKYIDNIGNGKCILCSGDMIYPETSKKLVNTAIENFGNINIIVNNCATQNERKSILDISEEDLLYTFQVNIFSYFYLVKETLPYLHEWDSIINTSSIVGYKGSSSLLDYSSSKGAVTSFTRSLALNLINKKIRVNSCAPGPFWTALQPQCWDTETTSMFGSYNRMGRSGQPFEIVPTYIYLASDDSRYVTGECLHVNGGDYISS